MNNVHDGQAVEAVPREDAMTISEASPDEFTPGQENSSSGLVCGMIKVALVVAAITGAYALVSGWFGDIGIDGADLMSLLGGNR